MEILNLVFVCLGIFSFVLMLLFFGFGFYFLYKINKKINELNLDISDALTKMIGYLNKEFKENTQAHQDSIDWHYKNLEKITEFNNQYFNLIASQNNNNSASINVLMELLGYRPKFDENQVEKPKVNYGQPPAPQKLEGLKINDKDN